MQGIVGIVQLLSNKDKLAELIKGETPKVLDTVLAKLAEHAGADPLLPFAVTFYKANTPRGVRTVAKVSTVDAFGDPKEELQTVDVADTMQTIPNTAITSLLPF